MMLNTLFFPAVGAIAIFILYLGTMQFVQKQDNMRTRVRRIAGTEEEAPAEAAVDSLYYEHEPSGLANFCDHMLRLMGTNTEAYRKAMQLRFYQAGIQSPDAPIYYLLIKRVGVVFWLLIAFRIGSIPSEGSTTILYYIIAFFLLVAGLFGPYLYLQNLRDKRKVVLQRSFPDALDLMLVCVESGLALDGALSRVCKELGRAHPEITQELNRTRLELTLLNDRAQALNNLAERTDMLAFRSLVTTLLQSERFGTSLTDTLRVLSEDYRNTRLMLAEEKAGRLPVMMTIPLILLLMPALFLIILGPAMLKVVGILHS